MKNTIKKFCKMIETDYNDNKNKYLYENNDSEKLANLYRKINKIELPKIHKNNVRGSEQNIRQMKKYKWSNWSWLSNIDRFRHKEKLIRTFKTLEFNFLFLSTLNVFNQNLAAVRIRSHKPYSIRKSKFKINRTSALVSFKVENLRFSSELTQIVNTRSKKSLMICPNLQNRQGYFRNKYFFNIFYNRYVSFRTGCKSIAVHDLLSRKTILNLDLLIDEEVKDLEIIKFEKNNTSMKVLTGRVSGMNLIVEEFKLEEEIQTKKLVKKMNLAGRSNLFFY